MKVFVYCLVAAILGTAVACVQGGDVPPNKMSKSSITTDAPRVMAAAREPNKCTSGQQGEK